MTLVFINVIKSRLFWAAMVLTAIIVVFCVPIAFDIRQLDANTPFLSPFEITKISRVIIFIVSSYFVGVCFFLLFSQKKNQNYFITEYLLFCFSILLITSFSVGLFRKLILGSGTIVNFETIGGVTAIGLCILVDTLRKKTNGFKK
jgi:hypothetical protein